MKAILAGIFLFLSGIIVGMIYVSLNAQGIVILPISGERAPQVKKNVIGFLPYWLLDTARPSYTGQLTNLSYFSLTINGDGTIQKKVNAQEEEPGWTTLKKAKVKELLAKAKVDGLTTSLVVFNANEEHIDQLLSDPVNNAERLIEDIAPIMKEHNFDDLNIDIESIIEASASSQQQFTQFVETIKNRMKQNNLGTVTVDMTVMSLFQKQRINPVEIGRIADRIVLMTYDYHYPGSILTGAVSPLQGAGEDRYNDVTKSIEKALEFVPSEKLILGIPLYGYEWETIRKEIGSPIIPRTGKTASDKRAVNTLLDCLECISLRDTVSDEPFIIFPKGAAYHQIFYTDKESIKNRLRLTTTKNIGGVAFWALGYEANDTLEPLNAYIKSVGR